MEIAVCVTSFIVFTYLVLHFASIVSNDEGRLSLVWNFIILVVFVNIVDLL